jgi:hypothetical protein
MIERHHDSGASCACSSEHRPAPLEFEWHHIRPLYLGGSDTPTGVLDQNGIWLCPTAHMNVHELLRLILKASREITYNEFIALYDPPVNKYCYTIALTGYRRFMDGVWSA